jgi:5-amino-6-(5-phospho-D-ribitylamino)uracil phosphatase
VQIAESPLYICDLDGTLLGSDGALSEFARYGLNELLSAGIRLTVASSRATPAMRALLAGVNFDLPVIEFNGAFVSERGSGRHLASNVLSRSAACAAVGAILATGADPVVSAWDGSRDRVHFGSRMNEGSGW